MTHQGRHFTQAVGPSDASSKPTGPRRSPSPSLETKVSRPLLLVFVALVMAVCVTPLLGMLAGRQQVVNTQDSAESLPALIADGKPNPDFLRSLGSYFEEHMAFKNQLITADAALRAGIFKVSNTKQVIVGIDDWIYYGGTLDNFLGNAQLSDRELDNIAFNLSLLSGYAKSQGSRLVVTITPNKNTIYPEHMPSWLIASGEQHDAERIVPFLEHYGITYANLIEVLRDARDQDLYFRRDSHWNDRGALVGYNAILDAAGIEHERYEGVTFTTGQHTGDIDAMLFPSNTPQEEVPVVEGGYDFSFVGPDTDVTASLIETTGAGTGRLLMYRDSFANNLLQPLSAAFASSTFTNLVPYDFGKIEELRPTLVVVERVERHLSDLDRNVPILPAPSTSIEPEGTIDVPATMEWEENGPFTVFHGCVSSDAVADALVDEDTGFYVQIVSASQTLPTLTAFRATVSGDDIDNPYGFQAYVPTANLPEGPYQVRLVAFHDGAPVVVAQMGMNQEG